MGNLKKVTKSELAREIGKTPQYISKLVRQGLFDKCMAPDGKKIYLNKALEALSKGRRGKFDHNVITPSSIKNDGQIYNADSLEELDLLLLDAKSPSQKVQIVKDFWLGKINRQKFLQNERELIPIHDAKATIEILFSPLSKKLDNLHIDLKARFTDVPLDAIEWISDEINSMKQSLQNYDYENNTHAKDAL